MSNYKPLLSLLTFMCLMVCCNDSNRQYKNDADTTANADPDPAAAMHRLYELDSITLSMALPIALAYAKEHHNEDQFTHEINVVPVDSLDVTIQLYFGTLFSKDSKHLLIRRQTLITGAIDILLLENDSFRIVCRQEYGTINYLGDTLRDVNGDGYKDFLFHSYATSGCCRRNEYDVYLYLSATSSFTPPYNFINPTFSPGDKIIRGVLYGHSGLVPLYKYKWNGLRVDTLEFVQPDTANKGQYFITRSIKWPISSRDIKKTVKSLPPEYRHIEDIDWFLQYLKE